MMVHFNEKCQTERSNWSCCHVLVLWVLDVRSTVGAPDWARVQFKIRVLKRWKRFYIKHTEGNIHTDVLHYELCSDFSVSLWISFQFHRQHFSSVMFWSCVISVEMSVCAEEMLRNELCWFKGMNWIIWWIIRFNTFHVFIISLNMWARFSEPAQCFRSEPIDGKQTSQSSHFIKTLLSFTQRGLSLNCLLYSYSFKLFFHADSCDLLLVLNIIDQTDQCYQ